MEMVVRVGTSCVHKQWSVRATYMTAIQFTVTHHFDAPSRLVWDEMIDWQSHAQWIPATRVEVDGDGPAHSVDDTFTGYTGYGPATLVDRMRVSEIDWNDETGVGSCEVEKLGPVLHGTAGFTVTPDGDGCRVDWFEKVTVKYLPRVVAPVVSKASAAGFGFGMKRLAKVIDAGTQT